MCIIGIAYRAARRYPLIVAANRDERHARPTTPAAWWADRTDILSGRDLLAGGTWLGVNRTGRFAAVTNVFDGGPGAAAISRGALVGNFLASSVSARSYAHSLLRDRESYGPYNLILLDRDGLQFTSNRRETAALDAGIHACSNNQPGTDWPKLRVLTAALRASIDGADHGSEPQSPDNAPANDRLAGDLLEMLAGPAARGSRESAPDSLFILGNEFGTRCSTVLIVDSSGRALFIERSFGPDGAVSGTRRFAFDAPGFAAGGA